MLRVKVDKRQLNSVIKHLSNFQNKTKSKMTQILERLSAEGLEIARYSLGDLVFVEEIADGVSICTNSQEAIFIEFGAGFGATHPLAFKLGYYEGSWSEKHAMMFIEKGYWYYNGKKISRIPAQMGLYDTGKYIKSIAEKVVMEVFNNND